MNFALRNIFAHTSQAIFLHALKTYDVGPTALLLFRRKVCSRFLSPLKAITSAGFKPSILGLNGKHGNRYTTVATILLLLKLEFFIY
jgi:hypothetical protein